MVERDGYRPQSDEEKFDAGSQRGTRSGREIVSRGESSDWSEQDIPHEQLVATIKDLLDKKRKRYERFGGDFDPILDIHEELDLQTRQFLHSNEEKANFFWELRNAWDALTFDHYEPGDNTESLIGSGMTLYTGGGERTRSVQLDHPLQVKLLDALTEAVGVEHEPGRQTIPIPDRLLYHHKLVLTKEYQKRFEETMRKRKL